MRAPIRLNTLLSGSIYCLENVSTKFSHSHSHTSLLRALSFLSQRAITTYAMTGQKTPMGVPKLDHMVSWPFSSFCLFPCSFSVQYLINEFVSSALYITLFFNAHKYRVETRKRKRPRSEKYRIIGSILRWATQLFFMGAV